MDDNEPLAVEDARKSLQNLLAEQAQTGVPELTRVALLREQAVEIERLGYIPRRWGQHNHQKRRWR
jgi:hypothetical protein